MSGFQRTGPSAVSQQLCCSGIFRSAKHSADFSYLSDASFGGSFLDGLNPFLHALERCIGLARANDFVVTCDQVKIRFASFVFLRNITRTIRSMVPDRLDGPPR